MSWPRDTRLFVTAPAGTEPALKAELRDLGLAGAKADRGGVRVRGGLEAIARICFRSRVAVRVLIEVGSFDAPDARALYRGVSRVDWGRWLTPERTLSVRASARESRLRHTGFLAQKTKDAIVDAQRRAGGARSSVDRRDPDLGVFVRLSRDRATVFLDASGGSLHRRGWRTEGGRAPLKENLAAALVRLSGWDRRRPLLDPLAGSGTIPIEADLLARDLPAQSSARRFAFERWADHDADARARVAAERARGASRARDRGPPCHGSDRDEGAVRVARANAARTRSCATFRVCSLADARPEVPSQVVANPHYGERLEAGASWTDLAEAVERWREQRVTLLLPEGARLPGLSRRPASERPLFNGALRCRLVTWEPG